MSKDVESSRKNGFLSVIDRNIVNVNLDGFTESSTDPPAVPPANRQVGGAAVGGGSKEGALNGHVRTVRMAGYGRGAIIT